MDTKGHCFPKSIIIQAVYLKLRFSLRKVLPIPRTTFGHFLIDYYHDDDDVNQCYITGNNLQSYSGY